jgi:hypothetical protein
MLTYLGRRSKLLVVRAHMLDGATFKKRYPSYKVNLQLAVFFYPPLIVRMYNINHLTCS